MRTELRGAIVPAILSLCEPCALVWADRWTFGPADEMDGLTIPEPESGGNCFRQFRSRLEANRGMTDAIAEAGRLYGPGELMLVRASDGVGLAGPWPTFGIIHN